MKVTWHPTPVSLILIGIFAVLTGGFIAYFATELFEWLIRHFFMVLEVLV